MKNVKWLKVICLLSLVLFCSSCATTTRHAPEDIPDEELAIVKTGYGVTIGQIDSQKCKSSSTVILEPGVHTLSLWYSADGLHSMNYSHMKYYFGKGIPYKIVGITSGYTITYHILIDAPTTKYMYNPVNEDLPVFTQEVIDGVQIFEGIISEISFTPIANIELEFGKPIFFDDPEYEDEVNLFKKYAYEMGANAVFCFSKSSQGGVYPTDTFSGCAVKIDGEIPEKYLY